MTFPYPIVTNIITNARNRSGKNRSETRYLVVHETVSKATADAEVNFFDTHTTETDANAFIDWVKVELSLPVMEEAWAVGPNANRFTFNVELCHARTEAEFDREWEIATAYFAKLCHDWHMDPLSTVKSHKEIGQMFGGTDHTDPDAYFAEFHKDMGGFRADVVKQLAKLYGAPAPVKVTIPVPSGDPLLGLHYVHTGAEVMKLQNALNHAHYGFPPIHVDGDFGQVTEQAVQHFQHVHGLTSDGVYGRQTAAALNVAVN